MQFMTKNEDEVWELFDTCIMLLFLDPRGPHPRSSKRKVVFTSRDTQ